MMSLGPLLLPTCFWASRPADELEFGRCHPIAGFQVKTPSCKGLNLNFERAEQTMYIFEIGHGRCGCSGPSPFSQIASTRSKRWGNRPASLWIAEELGCCASG